MTKDKTDTSTEKSIKVDDLFWGQPHHENETFSAREFEYDFIKVYGDEPFLGMLSVEIGKFPDPKIPTACVGLWFHPDEKEYVVIMKYNPYFFRSMTSIERQGVIVHELLHVALLHLMERRVSDKNYQDIWNIATDLAINSIIGANKLPDFCLIPGKVPTKVKDKDLIDFILKATPLQASELYFEGLKKLLEQKQKEAGGAGFGGFGNVTLDDHDVWDNIPSDIRDLIKSKMQGMLERATRNADRTQSWGTIPQEIQALIRKMLAGEVDWRSIMKMFFATARSMNRRSTMKKISKKAPYKLPGARRSTIAKFAFFIDQSGSMADEDVAMCFAEVENASKETEIDVYNFDTEVDEKSHRLWKRGQKFPWKRTRCGGTDFNCVKNFMNDQRNRGKHTGCVILTDGYAPVMGQVLGARVLWIVTPQGTKEHIRQGDLVVQLDKKGKK